MRGRPETADQRRLRNAPPSLLARLASTLPRREADDRAAERRRSARARKVQRRQVKAEARLVRVVPVAGPTNAAARRARVRAARIRR